MCLGDFLYRLIFFILLGKLMVIPTYLTKFELLMLLGAMRCHKWLEFREFQDFETPIDD
jgi:hypothetical protein